MARKSLIKAWRLRQKPPVSQAELARRVATTRMTVCRWEAGERKPDPGYLPKLSEITGIPARELRADLAELLGAAE